MTGTRTDSTSSAIDPVDGTGSTVADVVDPLLATLLGDPLPLRVELWDGSARGPGARRTAGTPS